MKLQRSTWLWSVAMCAVFTAACEKTTGSDGVANTVPAAAAGLDASVTDAKGGPLTGAMVTLVNGDESRLTTRYTDQTGHVRFPDLAPDQHTVRFRLIGYADHMAKLDGGAHVITARLTPATQDELLASLPANVWLERVHAPNERVNREFRVQCMMCHQMGYANTRAHKGREDWYGIYEVMANKGTRALLTRETRDTMADALTTAFDAEGKMGMPRVPTAPSGEATKVEITEWRLKDETPSMHDVAVGPDGKIYGADTVGNNIWRLDPTTNEITELTDLRPANRPAGAPLVLHTVTRGPDGKMWFTYALGNMIMSLDVATSKTKVYDVPYSAGLYPHTMRFDRDGQLWFTVSHTNQLGTIDPLTDKVVLYAMPTRNKAQADGATPEAAMRELRKVREGDAVIATDGELTPIPYGIATTPDGKIWFSQFNNRRIGSFDKKTRTFTMVDTPFGGPRRFRSDSHGDLWIPAYVDGSIYRYEPANGKFKRFDLPTGRGDAVYALNVDPKDDTVWACGSNSDTMMHLMPTTGKIITYSLPSHVTFCREINFARDGSIWTSYSQYPSATIEGGSSTFVRIVPV